MNIGIVGHEAAKFTNTTRATAREVIRRLIDFHGVTVVSGHCHLGGIDIWAEEEADQLGKETLIFPPKELNWANGFKARNIQIAKASDIVHVILVRELPPDYRGMRFKKCYHCDGDKTMLDHVKSGGCWTGRYAKNTLHKPVRFHVIDPSGSLSERFYG